MMRHKIKDILFQNRFCKSVKRKEIPVSEWLKTKILGLGLVNFSLYVILNITGILLMFYYIPEPERAYQSVKDLEFAVSFGGIIRNMHRWAGFIMIVTVLLHMSRVYYMAEYREPREFNWVTGMTLFLLTLASGLTGYILLWDQKAYWGTTILSNVAGAVPVIGEKLKYVVLGGTAVGQSSLLRAYAVHVKALPLIMGLIMAVHFWRTRSDDFIAETQEPDKEDGQAESPALQADGASELGTDTWSHIVKRDFSKFLLVLALVMGASILFDAPLEEMANPSVTPNPTKAIWFFVGLQELLSWGAPFWWAIVVPNAVILLLMVVPYLDRSQVGTGVWFHPSRRLQNILFTAFVTIFIGLIIVGQFLRGPGWTFYWPWQPWPIH